MKKKSSDGVKPYKYEPKPRDPKCSKDFMPMVMMQDIVKGWQWVCLKCDKRHNIPQNTYELGKDNKE